MSRGSPIVWGVTVFGNAPFERGKYRLGELFVEVDDTSAASRLGTLQLHPDAVFVRSFTTFEEGEQL
jgi:hypothetical protein